MSRAHLLGDHKQVIFRRVARADYPAILRLQDANLLENLIPRARKNGYLSARLTAEQFARIDADVAVVVASDSARIAGYACASGVEFNRGIPLVASMIERFGKVMFGGRALTALNVFIYGPVCVDADYRGSGVLRGLYGGVCAEAAGRFDAGVGLVAEDNPRSLDVHLRGLGMQSVGDFQFDERHYKILAFSVPG